MILYSFVVEKLKNAWYLLWQTLNLVIPKKEQAIIFGNDSIETNAIETANYIAYNTTVPVYLVVEQSFHKNIRKILHPKVKVVDYHGIDKIKKLLLSRYIFATHDINLRKTNKNQTYINLWHGAAYKKIRKGRGQAGIPADITLATSQLERRVFSEFFGVSEETVFISGYPRNDLMIRAISNRNFLKSQLRIDRYQKIIVWLPTFRRSNRGNNNRVKVGNDFNVPDFDINHFNEILKSNNTICFLKTHYFYKDGKDSNIASNIRKIDDEWLLKNGITLYHFLPCTDVLISDFSSVIMDYSLLNKPIICFSKDLEEYKDTQGLYFEDIEDYLPSPLFNTDVDFFSHLKILLSNSPDPFISKREKVKKVFFKYHDNRSTKRIIDYVFNYRKK